MMVSVCQLGLFDASISYAQLATSSPFLRPLQWARQFREGELTVKEP